MGIQILVTKKNKYIFLHWYVPPKAIFLPFEPKKSLFSSKKKRYKKQLKYTSKLFRKNLKVSINSTRKVISIKGQRKAFYRQRIPEYSCASILIFLAKMIRNNQREKRNNNKNIKCM